MDLSAFNWVHSWVCSGMKLLEAKAILDRHWMRCLLRMQLGKCVLSPEIPDQSPSYVANCRAVFSSPSSDQSFLLGGISTYGRFYYSCHVRVWTLKCNRNFISWRVLSLVMTSAGKRQKVSGLGFICSGLTLLPIKIMRAGFWCHWDSVKPILRLLRSPSSSLHHSRVAVTEGKWGHAGKWEPFKRHRRQGVRCV